MIQNSDVATLEKTPGMDESPKEVWKRWMTEIAIADKAEEPWRKESQEVIDIYRNKKKTVRFNILYSNTQTVSPALYLNTPRPDIRRRFAVEDPVAQDAAETIEKVLVSGIDAYDFDHHIKGSVLDYQLTGRGMAWVDYEPVITTREEPVLDMMGQPSVDEMGQPVTQTLEEIAYQSVKCRKIPWDEIRFGYAAAWEDTPWIRLKHELTKEQLVEKFGDNGLKVKLDIVYADEKDKKETDALKRGCVYEIWSKLDRKIYFISPSVEEGPLEVKEDPYQLEGFYPCPRPLLYVSDPDGQKPIVEYRLYKDLAEELNTVSKRIKNLTSALKARGIYDSTLTQMSELMKGEDADFLPSSGATALMQMGGIDKAIWMLPIEKIVAVLVQLYAAREQIKQAIFEITGISDIIRGQSDPRETLGAQSIKAQFGGLRMKERQRDVQTFVRDIFRIKADIIAKKFEPEILSLYTGKPVDPMTLDLLRSDMNRAIRVDVETDSTIAQDQEADKKNVTELLSSITQFVGAWAPIVASGFIPVEVPKALLLSATRRFDMGREVEDALNKIGEQLPQQPMAPMAGAQASPVLPPSGPASPNLSVVPNVVA